VTWLINRVRPLGLEITPLRARPDKAFELSEMFVYQAFANMSNNSDVNFKTIITLTGSL